VKQHEAVIQSLDRLGGQATLADLYRDVLQIKECEWKTKTPFASIRRIVQQRREIFKVRPGLWALRSYKDKLGLSEYSEKAEISPKSIEQNHSYYQGMLVIIGNLRKYSTYIPNQDKSKMFVNKPLEELRSLKEIPKFSHDSLVNRSATIDVIWFNDRLMPHSFFEIEHTTDIQNSLLKYCDLQDFYVQMIIVSDEKRHAEYKQKLNLVAFADIRKRVNFLSYNILVRQYEFEIIKANRDFVV